MNHRPLGQEYITKADELLADGDWHDGLDLLIAIEKLIPPGIAQRRTERIRANSSSAAERAKPLSWPAQIAMGKRSITQAFVHSRIAQAEYEVTPWPMPKGGWRQGGWEIRRLPKEQTVTLTQASSTVLHVEPSIMRALIRQDPPLRTVISGRVTRVYVSDLEELQHRLDRYRQATAERRRVAYLPTGEAPCLSGGQLAERSQIARRTVRQLQQANPDLGWVVGTRGSAMFLPTEKLGDWDKVVEAYKTAGTERRSTAAKITRAR